MKDASPLFPIALWHWCAHTWWRAIERRILELDPMHMDLLEAIERKRHHAERFNKLLGLDPTYLSV